MRWRHRKQPAVDGQRVTHGYDDERNDVRLLVGTSWLGSEGWVERTHRPGPAGRRSRDRCRGHRGCEASAAVYANATTLVSDRPAQDRAFGWLAALELLALVMVPGLYVVSRARRQRGQR